MSPVRLGKYVWAWLVNGDDWACRLGHCGFQSWARRLTRPLSCGVESAEASWLEGPGQSPWYPQYLIKFIFYFHNPFIY